jgi:glycosyltransferase involved in cell wall biosynthesis
MVRRKIFITGSAGIPARYGGFETYAENISSILVQSYDITVICSKDLYLKSERKDINKSNLSLIYLPFKPNGISSLFYDLVSLLIAFRKADFIIQLGSGGAIFLPLIKIFRKMPVATHIDGLEWERSKWNKFAGIFLRLSGYLAIKYSDFILTDNVALHKYIPKKLLKKVILTTYGADHLPIAVNLKKIHNRDYALVIARAEPENNIHVFLELFKKLKSLDLIVVSNWMQTGYGRKLFKEYNSEHNLKLIGPIYDDPLKLQCYRNQCKVYLHGHSAGGTNPSLVEAMYSGIPVIAHDNVFNRQTTNNLALFFKSTNELMDLMVSVAEGHLEFDVITIRDYAIKNYTWEKAVAPIYDMINLV